MATSILWAFIGGEVLTLGALAWLGSMDQANIEKSLIPSGDRIINHQVVMTLLGATAAQVGVVAVIIARYSFPNRPGDA